MKKTLLWALALVVLIGGAAALYAALAPMVSPQTEAPQDGGNAGPNLAPDFTVYDAAGNPYTLADFGERPLLLNFWASWCGPCKSEMPDLDALYAEYGGEVGFVMINLTDGARETQQTAADYIASEGYAFPVYYDLDGSAALAYAVTGIPRTVFVTDGGAVYADLVGAQSEDGFRRRLEPLAALERGDEALPEGATPGPG